MFAFNKSAIAAVCGIIVCAVLPFADFISNKHQIYPFMYFYQDPIFENQRLACKRDYYLYDPAPVLVETPQLIFSANQVRKFKFPVWDPYSACGTPLLGSFIFGLFSPFNILLLIFPFIKTFDYIFIARIMVSFLGVFFLCRKFGFSVSSSFIGGASYSLSGASVTPQLSLFIMGNNTALLPWALFAAEHYISGPSIFSAVICGCACAFLAISGQPTAIPFMIAAIILFACLRLFYFHKTGISGVKNNIFPLLIAFLCIAAVQIIPFLEFLKQGWTYKIFNPLGFRPDFGFHPISLATLFYPMPLANSFVDWFSRIHISRAIPGCFYIGLLPLSLCLYGVRKKTFFLWIPLLAGLITVFSVPLLNITLYIPFIKNFNRIYALSIPVLFMCLLAAAGFERLMHNEKKVRAFINIFTYVLAAGIFAVILLIFYGDTILSNAPTKIMKVVALWHSAELTWSWMLTGLIAAGLCFCITLKKAKYIIAILIVIIILDLWSSSFLLLSRNTPVTLSETPPAVNWLKKNIGNYRCVAVALSPKMQLAFQNYRLMPPKQNIRWEIRDIRTIDAMHIKRYRLYSELINKQGPTIVSFEDYNAENRHLYNRMSVKYILIEKNDPKGKAQAYLLDGLKNMRNVYEDNTVKIYEDKQAFPRAFFTNSYELVESGDYGRVSQKLLKNTRDVVIENDGKFVKNPNLIHSSPDEQCLLRDEPDFVEIKIKNNSAGFFVLNDTYYSKWKAYLDGRRVKIYPANLMMRGVYIEEAGVHSIVFKY